MTEERTEEDAPIGEGGRKGEEGEKVEKEKEKG